MIEKTNKIILGSRGSGGGSGGTGITTEALYLAASEASGEATGWSNQDNIDVYYDKATRRIRITGDTYLFYKGEIVTGIAGIWWSTAHQSGITSPMYLWYNGTDFVWTFSVWDFSKAPIAYVYYDSAGVFRFALREVHGMKMDSDTHRNLHADPGTKRQSGGNGKFK